MSDKKKKKKKKKKTIVFYVDFWKKKIKPNKEK